MQNHTRVMLRGAMELPGDKSISHRAVMLGSIAGGRTEIQGFLPGEDCLSTIRCFRAMGTKITQEGTRVTVQGMGLHGLKAPSAPLDCGNSGTTMRLLSGILAAQSFSSVLTGDSSLRTRPMGRIMRPLREMGAEIQSLAGSDTAPLRISGGRLSGIHYLSPVASAQLKSAVLLAGLYADSPSSVTEPSLSRDHSERMLRHFGAKLHSSTDSEGRPVTTIEPAEALHAAQISVPGDLSSAAYFIAAALLLPGSELRINKVGVNPTRSGILEVAEAMGGSIEVLSHTDHDAEPTADLLIRASRLHGTEIGGALIPRLIDELPVIAAMACQAEGRTVIRDAAELKLKESNRIRVMTEELQKLGAAVTETTDGMIIEGGHPLHGASIASHKDHRIAMSFAVLSLLADGPVHISDPDCVNISMPDFYERLRSVCR